MKKPRIFIGPIEIAGYYHQLAKGLRQLGLDCDLIEYAPHRYQYSNVEQQPLLLRAAWRLQQWSHAHSNPLAGLAAICSALLCRCWGIRAIWSYDVYIFGYGQSLEPTWNLDLPILKKLGKTVISNLGHGSEVRPAYLNGTFQDPRQPDVLRLHTIRRAAKLSRQRLARHERQATICIGAPLSTSQFASQRFINWFAIGVPCSPPGGPESPSAIASPRGATAGHDDASAAIRILHCPSHPLAKGSAVIANAMANLKGKGYAIDFVQLTGVTNATVIEAIRGCDFVVDQVYSDTPLATFATEAAWQGKPAVVGGYGLENITSWWAAQEHPPVQLCHPDQLEQAIEFLVLNPGERQRLGNAARRFVQHRWNAAAVARRYRRLMASDIPEDWWCDPALIAYCHGCGQSEERTRSIISMLLQRYGPRALQLQHRPELLQQMIAFAGPPRGEA